MFKFSIILLVICSYHISCEKVIIKQGVLEGFEDISRGGNKFHSFLGIPYAKPPVGNLRFQSPQPHPGWTGVRKASVEGSMCLQDMFLIPKYSGTPLGEEDCLFVNVHTPQVHPSKKLPVMVFIYGGAFQMGDSGSLTYGPYYLMDRDIVYVNFNYRLGILGFLSFEDKELPGNFGLKDQHLALKWIKENIGAFGGDPNSITIFGESAGAASVHFQLLAPKSEGLFNNAILQSGSAFCPWALVPKGRARPRAEAVATLLGCHGNLSDLIKCLKNISYEAILKTQLKFTEWSIDPIISFAPVIEVSHSDAFITKHPYYYKTHINTSVIVGINNDEGAMRTSRLCADDMSELKQLNESWDTILPISMMIRESADPLQIPVITKSLRKFYLADKYLDEGNIKSLSNMYSDTLINYHTLKAAEHTTSPVYFYLYNYQSQMSWTSVFGNCSVPLGVSHADELINLFNLDSLFQDALEGEHLEMSHKLIQLWTNFAKTGVPVDDKRDIQWKPFDSNAGREFLYISNNDISMHSKLFEERLNYIETLPTNYRKIFQRKIHEKTEL